MDLAIRILSILLWVCPCMYYSMIRVRVYLLSTYLALLIWLSAYDWERRRDAMHRNDDYHIPRRNFLSTSKPLVKSKGSWIGSKKMRSPQYNSSLTRFASLAKNFCVAKFHWFYSLHE